MAPSKRSRSRTSPRAAAAKADPIQETIGRDAGSPEIDAVLRHGGKLADVEYEFGGPAGAVFIMLSLPLTIWALFFLCNDQQCLSSPLNFDWAAWWAALPGADGLISTRAVHIVLGWLGLQVAMQLLLPGETVQGAPVEGLHNRGGGGRLYYIMSGHLQFWLSFAAVLFGAPRLLQELPGVYGVSSLTQPLALHVLYDEYAQLIGAACLVSLLLSIYLYASSFWPAANGSGGRVLAKGGVTGSTAYDFFIGRELNPRLFGDRLDLKCFCELRPGLIGWAVLNVGMAYKQYQNNASFRAGHISLSMLLVCLSQGLYVWDALYQERAILSTMDITTDGFGYMLAFGDLAWVPFVYSLQARFLVDHDPQLGLPALAGCMIIQAAGYYIFRSANSQKDAFRRDPEAPEVAHLSSMTTKRGTRLLTSGWWGAARKINYTGDWLITLSWCLLCGVKSPIPYFQAAYFLVLLIHRAVRDDAMCAEKYGKDWDEYKRQVPYLFIPGVW